MDRGAGDIFDGFFVEGSTSYSFVNTEQQVHQGCEIHIVQLKNY